MTRKHTKRRARPGMHPLDAITACQPFPEAEITRILLKVDSAFEHLSTGGTDVEQFDRMAAVLNVGLIRCEEIAGSQDPTRSAGVALFLRAQAALMEADEKLGRHGKFGFTGPGLEAMRDAIALYGEILKASTPRQMDQAQQECIRRVRAGHVEQAAAATARAAA